MKVCWRREDALAKDCSKHSRPVTIPCGNWPSWGGSGKSEGQPKLRASFTVGMCNGVQSPKFLPNGGHYAAVSNYRLASIITYNLTSDCICPIALLIQAKPIQCPLFKSQPKQTRRGKMFPRGEIWPTSGSSFQRQQFKMATCHAQAIFHLKI